MVVQNTPRFTAGDDESTAQAKFANQVSDLTATVASYRQVDSPATDEIGIGDVSRHREKTGAGNPTTTFLSGVDTGNVNTTSSGSNNGSGSGGLGGLLGGGSDGILKAALAAGAVAVGAAVLGGS